MKLPLSASDLHAIGDALDPIELLPAITQNARHRAHRSHASDDGDGNDLIGYFVREGEGEDAWFGFEAGADA